MATQFHAFSDLPVGQQPEGWTKHHFSAANARWLGEYSPAGRVLRASSGTGGHLGYSALYNTAAVSANGQTVEVVSLGPALAAGSTPRVASLILRGSPASGAHVGYELECYTPDLGQPAAMRIWYRFETGTAAFVAPELLGLPFILTADLLVARRFRVETVAAGIRARGKAWVWNPNVRGFGEPGGWFIDSGDFSSLGVSGWQAGGLAGLGSFLSPPSVPGTRSLFTGFATDGDTAPLRPTPAAFHIDPQGSDSADGLTPQTAWRTLGKVNVMQLVPGDEVRLARRGVPWRESLDVEGAVGTVDSPILVTGYEPVGAVDGGRPVVTGADPVTGWVPSTYLPGPPSSVLVWEVARAAEPYVVTVDGTPWDRGSTPDALAPNHQRWLGGKLYLRMDAGNPDTVGALVEASAREYPVRLTDCAHVVFDGVDATSGDGIAVYLRQSTYCTYRNASVRGAGRDAVSAYLNSGHHTIEDLDISYPGMRRPAPFVGSGNGVALSAGNGEMGGNVVRRCTIHRTGRDPLDHGVYDSRGDSLIEHNVFFDLQGGALRSDGTNVRFQFNEVRGARAGIVHVAGTIQAYHNTFYLDTPFTSGSVMVYYTQGGGHALELLNNAFHGAGVQRMVIQIDGADAAGITSDYNSYFALVEGHFRAPASSATRSFAEWRSLTGQDANSITVDPQLVLPYLHPADWSPLLRAGTPIASLGTYYYGDAPSIGAWQLLPPEPAPEVPADWASGRFAVHLDVLIERPDPLGGSGTIMQSYRNLEGKNWVRSLNLSPASADSPIGSGRLVLFRQVGGQSLAPLVSGSPLNNGTGGYAPALDFGREIAVRYAILPGDQEPLPGDWQPLFEGETDDPSWGSKESNVVEVPFRDLSGRLSDTYYRAKTTYGDKDNPPLAHTVAQQILDSQMGIGQYEVEAYPGPTTFVVRQYEVEDVSVWQALETLAESAGRVVRQRRSRVDGTFKISLIDPLRARTDPEYEVGPSTYLDVQQVGTAGANMRNIVRAFAFDSAGRELVSQYPPESQVLSDPLVLQYGPRLWQYPFERGAPIDTQGELDSFVDSVYADLSVPPFPIEIETRFCPFTEVGDLVRWRANDLLWDEDQVAAVLGLTHEFSAPGVGRTRWRLAGYPKGHYAAWLKRGLLIAGRNASYPAEVYGVSNVRIVAELTTVSHYAITADVGPGVGRLMGGAVASLTAGGASDEMRAALDAAAQEITLPLYVPRPARVPNVTLAKLEPRWIDAVTGEERVGETWYREILPLTYYQPRISSLSVDGQRVLAVGENTASVRLERVDVPAGGTPWVDHRDGSSANVLVPVPASEAWTILATVYNDPQALITSDTGSDSGSRIVYGTEFVQISGITQVSASPPDLGSVEIYFNFDAAPLVDPSAYTTRVSYRYRESMSSPWSSSQVVTSQVSPAVGSPSGYYAGTVTGLHSHVETPSGIIAYEITVEAVNADGVAVSARSAEAAWSYWAGPGEPA